MLLLALLSKSDKENFMKPKYFLLLIPAALIAFLLLYLIIIIVLYISPWGEVRPRAFPFGTEYKDDYINATTFSADFTDKININSSEIKAPQDNLYMIIDLEITAIDGNWSVMSDFTVFRNDLHESISFDRVTTNQLNGCDLLKLNSSEKQSVSLVFLLPKSELLTGYTMTIRYVNGACSEDFALRSLYSETTQA